MELSILIARIMAVIYLSAALGGFFNRDFFPRVSEDMYKNAALTYLLGLLALVIGSLIVHYHDIWVGDWPVLITVLGWIAVVKGIMIIAFPNAMQRLTRRLLAGAAPRIVPYFALSLGLLFGYLGFVR